MFSTDFAPSQNREYLAIDTDPTDVAETEAIFEADYNNKSLTVSGNLVVSPVNSRAKLVAFIATAAATIDIEAEELFDDGVVKALEAAADRGVKVRAVLATQGGALVGGASEQTAVASLKQHANISLVSLATPYIHAKSLVVDGVNAYVGSENFSTGSLSYNRELGVLIDNATEVGKILAATNKDFGAGRAL
jgi:phosphatidylserine/phosphatidylglycerophosphate/cardiolipin synthase-like enzyme